MLILCVVWVTRCALLLKTKRGVYIARSIFKHCARSTTAFTLFVGSTALLSNLSGCPLSDGRKSQLTGSRAVRSCLTITTVHRQAFSAFASILLARALSVPLSGATSSLVRFSFRYW